MTMMSEMQSMRSIDITARRLHRETAICDYPPELLAKILRRLAYFDIIRASLVCKFWNAVIKEDPGIAELLHKRTCLAIAEHFDLGEWDEPGEPVAVHPALQIISYSMGEKIETAVIHRSTQAPLDSPNGMLQFSIIDLTIANDFATRPTVTQFFIIPEQDFNCNAGLSGPFLAKATNTRGVTVLDVVQAIVRECLVLDSPVMMFPRDWIVNCVTDEMVEEAMKSVITPDGKRIGKWLNKADCLEGFRRYEGLGAIREGLRVNAAVRLGWQPVEDEFCKPRKGQKC
ncbi:hypothetical protein C8R45DRAFT_151991 [Mycena sanguinolenta]|nr:hypothetical protein C8R45DRAFT_151991 [Mycena sanguinolenta]